MSTPSLVTRGTEPTTSAPLVTELTARRLGPVRRYFARRPRAMDAVVMVLFALPAAFGSVVALVVPAGADVPPRDPGDLVLGLVLVSLGVAALNWRRRRPVLVAAAMTALDVVGMATLDVTYELGIAFAVYAVAASRPPRTTWTTFGVTTAVSTVTALLFVRVDTGTIVLSLLAVAIGTGVRNRRLHVAKIVERANALARDRDHHAQLARTAERTRIAREMHDVVAHNLAVMIALADGAGAALGGDPARARVALGEVSETGRGALADMRRVLGVLHEPDATFEPQPGSTDLVRLVERFRTAGLPVHADGLTTELPPDAGLQLTVYRIVSESLTNVLRHAAGTARVDLAVRRIPGGVEVDVQDQGVPTHVATTPLGGQGLIGMAERAAVYGGTVDAGPTGTGWRVHVVLPWDEEDA